MPKRKQPAVKRYKRPPRPAMAAPEFVGAWGITEFEGFAREYLYLCGLPHIEITSEGTGGFAFGAVQAAIDGRMDEFAAGVFSFAFEGDDEGDLFCGRGNCAVRGSILNVKLYRFLGDDFAFSAKRIEQPLRV